MMKQFAARSLCGRVLWTSSGSSPAKRCAGAGQHVCAEGGGRASRGADEGEVRRGGGEGGKGEKKREELFIVAERGGEGRPVHAQEC